MNRCNCNCKCKDNKSIATKMAKKGMRISTWANAKGLSKQDIMILNCLSNGRIQGRYGRAREA